MPPKAKPKSPKPQVPNSGPKTESLLTARTLTLVIMVILFIALFVVVMKYPSSSCKANVKKTTHSQKACGMSQKTVYFFYADWCPHSVKAKPEMDKFEAWLKTNHPDVKVERISTEHASSVQRDMMNCLNVQGIPSVYVLGKNGHFHKMHGVCTLENLQAFVKAHL